MEIIGEFIAQFIGEILLSLTKTIIYKIFIHPILIVFGFISISIEKLFKKDIKTFESTTYDELTTAGGDLIIGNLVIFLLVLIVFMIVYFGFYMFNN
jgi:hypothetical protein